MKLLIAALLFVGACASSGARLEADTQVISILTVQNQRPEDLTIYVMRAGYKGRRLGRVQGLSTATFVLNELGVPAATDVQFLAVALGTTGASELSEPIVAVRGASYQWQLAPGRGRSFAFRRHTAL